VADPKQKPPQKNQKEASKTKQSSKKNLSKQMPVPLLIETAFTGSKVVVIVLGVFLALVSLSSGNSLVTAAIHSIVGMIVIGIIAWLIVWMVVRGSMDSLISEIKQAKQAEPENTKDYTA
jgi:hypothetical protein